MLKPTTEGILERVQPLLSRLLARLSPPPPGMVYPKWDEDADSECLDREIRSITDIALDKLRDLLVRVLETVGAERRGAILRALGEMNRLAMQGDEVPLDDSHLRGPGNRHDQSGTNQAYNPPAGVESSVPRLPPATQRAWNQYQRAISAYPALEGKLDKDVYDYIEEQLLDEGESLPTLASFCRYLRAARRSHGKSKNLPRTGRSGRSIVSAENLDS